MRWYNEFLRSMQANYATFAFSKGCACACCSRQNCYSEDMVIEIQDKALRGLKLTEPQALLDLAVGLFTERQIRWDARRRSRG